MFNIQFNHFVFKNKNTLDHDYIKQSCLKYHQTEIFYKPTNDDLKPY